MRKILVLLLFLPLFAKSQNGNIGNERQQLSRILWTIVDLNKDTILWENSKGLIIRETEVIITWERIGKSMEGFDILMDTRSKQKHDVILCKRIYFYIKNIEKRTNNDGKKVYIILWECVPREFLALNFFEEVRELKWEAIGASMTGFITIK